MFDLENVVCIEGLGYDSNSYFFDDILVDTGTGINQDFLYRKLKENDIEPGDISLIVNTHCHFDHVGGNYLFPNAKVAIHKDDANTLRDDYNYGTAVDMFSQSIKRHDVDIELKENDKIGNFKVIHTPGHTPGGICLWDGETLISGDTVFANGGIGRMDIGGNYEDMKKSIDKLKSLDIKYLLPGHGSWTDKGREHIALSASNL
ncbi:MAG: MBL fold metallo-hydrolase [Methanobacteriaceae archaeon]|jgi:glyoxylase-like metal-dependent hydrolase (beta-lactamase superfamily II)|nr:MBL fold metallo-hydrolase [Methanobacteriaceae archaeon]